MTKPEPLQPEPLRLIPLSPVPLYNQLKEILRNRILDGTYSPHIRMPSENDLGQIFKVSRVTVRQALNDLQNEGLIFKIHGKGTFAAKPNVQPTEVLNHIAEMLSPN
jgi:GntR family transcriptional regulator